LILDAFNDLNWAAVGVALVAAFAIGSIWFAPPVLGNYWARQVSRYTGIPESRITEGAGRPGTLVEWVVVTAANAVVLGLAVEAIGADTAGEGIILGLVLGVGLGSTVTAWPPIFARMPIEWWLVNNGAYLLMQAAMGAILGAWQ
jgi:hypothetical protein